MIVQWFFESVSTLWRWMLGLVPADAAHPIEQVAPTVQDIITPFATGISSLGVWIPWDALAAALGATFALYSVTFALRLVRYIYGLIPFNGGGS